MPLSEKERLIHHFGFKGLNGIRLTCGHAFPGQVFLNRPDGVGNGLAAIHNQVTGTGVGNGVPDSRFFAWNYLHRFLAVADSFLQKTDNETGGFAAQVFVKPDDDFVKNLRRQPAGLWA